MKAQHTFRLSVLAGLSIAVTLVLSGCWLFGDYEVPQEQTFGDESVESDSTDSTVLPSTFPAEIPLLNSNIAFANYLEGESSWTVLLMTQDLNADFNSACSQLAEAGFANTFYQQEGRDSLATFDGASYRIQLVGRADAVHGDVLDYFVMSLE